MSRVYVTHEQCKAVASVVLGNPEKVEPVPVTGHDRFVKLRDREIDLLIYGDFITIEREVLEVSSKEHNPSIANMLSVQVSTAYIVCAHLFY